MSLEQLAPEFKSLEAQFVPQVEGMGREFYVQVVRCFQERWHLQHESEWSAVRRRAIYQMTLFWLLVRLPVRMVRRHDDGLYLTLSRVLLAPKATPLLSPLVEKRALEAVTGRNYRSTGRELSRGLRARVSVWVVP